MSTALLSWDTQRPADMIERNPDQPDELAVATYELQKGTDGLPDQRHGTIHRLRITCNAETEAPALEAVDAVDGTGVFDLKWHPQGNGAFSIAGADGSAHVYKDWRHAGQTPSVQCADAGKDDYCLCVGWSLDGQQLAYGSRNGRMCLADAASLEQHQAWDAHEHEVWVASWIDRSVLATGSDDGRLKLWDTRIGFDFPTASRRFDAGVTAVSMSGGNLLIGSYDERLHVLNPSALKRDLATSEPLGGGVWRVKPCPDEASDSLLVAAMQGGGYKLSVDGEEVVQEAHFGLHESMVYGCEWLVPSPGHKGLVATCSFYDHVLHVWE
ncbi:Diphthine methyltransferase-like protein [Diplonema papillatum]|nr:Diphthine methyltransferase-like protein [Diplonema papillatum]